MKNKTISPLSIYRGPHGKAIAALTGLSLDEISEMIFEAGLWYSTTYKGIEKELQYSALYWTWFKGVWYKLDGLFLSTVKDAKPINPDLLYMHHRGHIEQKIFIPCKTLNKIISEAKGTEKAVKKHVGSMDGAAMPLPQKTEFKSPLIRI